MASNGTMPKGSSHSLGKTTTSAARYRAASAPRRSVPKCTRPSRRSSATDSSRTRSCPASPGPRMSSAIDSGSCAIARSSVGTPLLGSRRPTKSNRPANSAPGSRSASGKSSRSTPRWKTPASRNVRPVSRSHQPCSHALAKPKLPIEGRPSRRVASPVTRETAEPSPGRVANGAIQASRSVQPTGQPSQTTKTSGIPLFATSGNSESDNPLMFHTETTSGLNSSSRRRRVLRFASSIMGRRTNGGDGAKVDVRSSVRWTCPSALSCRPASSPYELVSTSTW
jgi:hypothetical protein